MTGRVAWSRGDDRDKVDEIKRHFGLIVEGAGLEETRAPIHLVQRRSIVGGVISKPATERRTMDQEAVDDIKHYMDIRAAELRCDIRAIAEAQRRFIAKMDVALQRQREENESGSSSTSSVG